MWIAKPILQLSEQEQTLWEEIPNRPLAQTLAWARAIQAVSSQSYLVFSPDEGVGGIVFESPGDSPLKTQFECINGPLLDWDHPTHAARQLATFALAVSKLKLSFHSLTLRPRWQPEQLTERLRKLPVEVAAQDTASTLIFNLPPSVKSELFKTISKRLQRTLTASWKANIVTTSEKVTYDNLQKFVPRLTSFGKIHGFVTPPLPWFEALTQEPSLQTSRTPRFWIITSEKKEAEILQARTQIMICQMGPEAHYLFGHDERVADLRSAISTSATAQWEAITQCIKTGVETYDFNGYIQDAAPEHPYYGVCQFKKQFAGQIIRYVVPEFRIQ